jgi:hypothetical protein
MTPQGAVASRAPFGQLGGSAPTKHLQVARRTLLDCPEAVGILALLRRLSATSGASARPPDAAVSKGFRGFSSTKGGAHAIAAS